MNVLLTGETGTGKEVFARAIHENSARAEHNFVVVDCTALPATLVESVLFGHEKGAFTGADRAQAGLIKQAHSGTLFLDEIGELPLAVQKAFLRVLQEHRFRPVGAKREVESNFRLIAATNRNLEKMVQDGTFRSDLLFRVRTLTVELPPLSARKEDIKELAMYHMARVCERYQIGTKGFSPEFFDALMAYEWPGNVRELVNAMERAVSDCVPRAYTLPQTSAPRLAGESSPFLRKERSDPNGRGSRSPGIAGRMPAGSGAPLPPGPYVPDKRQDKRSMPHFRAVALAALRASQRARPFCRFVASHKAWG